MYAVQLDVDRIDFDNLIGDDWQIEDLNVWIECMDCTDFKIVQQGKAVLLVHIGIHPDFSKDTYTALMDSFSQQKPYPPLQEYLLVKRVTLPTM